MLIRSPGRLVCGGVLIAGGVAVGPYADGDTQVWGAGWVYVHPYEARNSRSCHQVTSSHVTATYLVTMSSIVEQAIDSALGWRQPETPI